MREFILILKRLVARILNTDGRLACFVAPRLDLVRLPETAIAFAASLSFWEAIGRFSHKSSKKSPYYFRRGPTSQIHLFLVCALCLILRQLLLSDQQP